MEEDNQARAYAEADFEAPHSMFVDLFRSIFPEKIPESVLDLGCGTADITIRFARAYTHCHIWGVDGSAAMLKYAKRDVDAQGLSGRISLLRGRIPHVSLPLPAFGSIISNSLLHHLPDPMVLWKTVINYGGPGTIVFIMDLLRPESTEIAAALVEKYSGNEPDVLKQDFFNSLLASFRIEEVEKQLLSMGLDCLSVSQVSDRHMVIRGRL